MTWARRSAALTAAVTAAAVLLQLVLVIDGASVLVTEDPPALWTRVGRFFSYFTIQSNVLVAVATLILASQPAADGAVFRSVRLAGLIGITVTGLVHFALLRPLLDLEGWSYVADKALHVVVPLLAVSGWLAFGPRGRIDRRGICVSFTWPLAWLAWTLTVGALTAWVPYPFLDVDDEGWGSVLVTCLGVVLVFSALVAAATYVDRRLDPVVGSRVR